MAARLQQLLDVVQRFWSWMQRHRPASHISLQQAASVRQVWRGLRQFAASTSMMQECEGACGATPHHLQHRMPRSLAVREHPGQVVKTGTVHEATSRTNRGAS
jgi:hypothetical protein